MTVKQLIALLETMPENKEATVKLSDLGYRSNKIVKIKSLKIKNRKVILSEKHQ